MSYVHVLYSKLFVLYMYLLLSVLGMESFGFCSYDIYMYYFLVSISFFQKKKQLIYKCHCKDH